MSEEILKIYEQKLPKETLEKSKKIPMPNLKLILLLTIGGFLIFSIFAVLLISICVNEEEFGLFDFLSIGMFICFAIVCIYGAKLGIDDYKSAKNNFRLYQIQAQLKIEAKQREQEILQNQAAVKQQQSQDEYWKLQTKREECKSKGIPCCPKCGSTSIATVNRGYSMVTGFIGSGKAVNVCQVCGHRFNPGT